MRSLILTTATRYLLPLMLLFSLFILLRGHHHPGGGFIGGLVASTAFALYGFAYGITSARRMLRVEPLQLIGVGLLIVLLSSLMAPLFTGDPYLTAVWGGREFPAIGKIGTPLFFEIAIYLIVIGVTLLIILSLAEDDPESESS